VPNSQFTSPLKIKNNGFHVGGPFTLYEDEVIVEEVTIRFLVMQKDQDGQWIRVGGQTTWKTGDGDWEEIVPLANQHVQQLRAGAETRAIGIAVALKRQEPPNPPAFDTLTWCVDVDVEDVRRAADEDTEADEQEAAGVV
jgi:hypothetical protein